MGGFHLIIIQQDIFQHRLDDSTYLQIVQTQIFACMTTASFLSRYCDDAVKVWWDI